MKSLLAASLCLALSASLMAATTPAPPSLPERPRDALPLDAANTPEDFRLHIDLSGTGGARVRLGSPLSIVLTGGGSHDLALEHPAQGPALLRVWSGGVLARGPEEVPAVARGGTVEHPGDVLRLDADFTAEIRFTSTGDGTLFAKCPKNGNWAPDSKALFIRDGTLVFDIGWLGAIGGGPRVDDGRPHHVVLRRQGNALRLWLDDNVVAHNPNFTRPDPAGHVVRIGRASPDFGGDLRRGRVVSLRFWSSAFADDAISPESFARKAEPPVFRHLDSVEADRPVIETLGDSAVASAWIQPLERVDHGQLVRGWNDNTLAEGRRIYSTLCVVCHGTREQPGSLPTALRFAEGHFKNGADPFSMYTTLTRGFGQMVAQPQFITAQKYAVIHYIRETFLRPHNPAEFVPITPTLLAHLPIGRARSVAEREDRSLPEYRRMDFGSSLFWTFEIAPGNIAQKGIAVRLDDGPGGVGRGRAWMIYDHETLRLGTATTGDFVDWKGIAFDGSHGTHTHLTGDRHFINPVGPGWASPEGSWKDPRPTGRDGRPYGPLPRAWARHRGLHQFGNRVVIASEVGGTEVLESPGWIDYGSTPVFTRTLNLGVARHPLHLRVAPESVQAVLAGDGTLRREAGFWVADLPSGSRTRLFISRADAASLAALVRTASADMDLAPLTRGGPRQWNSEVTTTSVARPAEGAFAVDDFPLPLDNPWASWMRPGGFDFTPDGTAAVVATWNGDVWRVDGIQQPAPAPLRWRRIATGLFQPLGVKFRGTDLFVTCRDQLARLRDLNGDGEVDFIECFNSDHQVTEHFHEFAMGLQTDTDGNFYYAKSGRHALPALVPHHGTLLRIRADGSQTDILATGFRAANGVAVEDDGSFWVTDQEGFWTPKNRINRVKPGGFYGNMFGYTSITNTSDSAMEPPMVWITNEKDRSPAELVRVPKGAWGSLGGLLLNLSYGTGRAFAVPHENIDGTWQGAVCELPIPAFGTGIMRGRFAPDGALYTCGMFAWAGNATIPGGFHRIRRLPDHAAHVPLSAQASPGLLTVTFSEPLDLASIQPDAFAFRVWSLRRSANYGSQHHDEHAVPIASASLQNDGRTLALNIPLLAPTQCYELKIRARGVDGSPVVRSLHGTLHRINPR